MAMASTKLSLHLLPPCAVVLLLVIITPADAQATLFVFGDSLFDPGNNNYINTTTQYQCNFKPYGESFFDTPTGRCTDGRTIPDFIAEFAGLPLLEPYLKPGSTQDFSYGTNFALTLKAELAGLPHLEPYLKRGATQDFAHGTNFASAGAGAIVETDKTYALNLKTQIQLFKDVTNKLTKKLGDNEAKKVISNAVYLMNFGSNDYTTIVDLNEAFYHSYTQDQYVEMIVSNLTLSIKEIYEMGGRKFGFLTMPPVGCFPSRRIEEPGYTCNEEMNTLTVMHNRKLSRSLAELQNELKEFTYSIYDIATAITNRMNNPLKYGYKSGITACCGSGTNNGEYTCGGTRGRTEYVLCDNASEYFFFDSSHPNEIAYKQFAEEFWQGDTNVVTPYNMKTLFQVSMSPEKDDSTIANEPKAALSFKKIQDMSSPSKVLRFASN